MKKLTLAVLISSALSAGAIAGDWDKKKDWDDKDKIESTFTELDNDENGFISQEEADDDDIADYFAKMDSNSDSQITEQEFNTYLNENPQYFEDDITASQTAAVSHSDKDEIESTFAELDNDENGYISEEEADDDDVSEHFAKIDSDSDNRLSEQEFNQHLQAKKSHYEDDITATAQTGAIGDVDAKYESDTTIAASTDPMDTDVVITERGQEEELTARSDMESDMEVNTEAEMQSEADMVASNEFDMMDTDRDGQLSKAEASQSGVNESFEDIDEDNNQLITRMEYSEYRQDRDKDDYNEDDE